MRSMSVLLAFCAVVLGCGGRDRAQRTADSAANAMPSDTMSVQGTGAATLPADSAAARDRARMEDSAGMAKRSNAPTRDTAPASSMSRSRADSDTATADSQALKRFKKPEIRPVYPPVDRSRTNQDTGATRDTSAGRDTSGQRGSPANA